MKVTDKQYALENKLLPHLNALIRRCTKKQPAKDSVLLVEGPEGEGKTNASCAIGYYVAEQTGREFSYKNFWFDPEKMLKFAQSTERQIIIWDEPALAGLSTQWWNEAQQNIIKLLMMARKKQHFIIINVVRFDKFKDYIIERALGMMRMLPQSKPGRFLYFDFKSLQALFNDWKTSRKRRYWMIAKKFGVSSCPMGQIPYVMLKVLGEEGLGAYEREKDKAIMSIGKKKSKLKDENRYLKWQITNLVPDKEKVAKNFGISVRSVYDWTNLPKKYKEIRDFALN